MDKETMWELYTKENEIKNATYESWSFGNSPAMANELAALVVAGRKTATASDFQLYEIEECGLPPLGGFNIILDGMDQAVCVTKTTKVYVTPFIEVSAEHAFKEGEGDRSLAYWRKVHQEFFSNELNKYGYDFSEDMLVVCEEFKLVYK